MCYKSNESKVKIQVENSLSVGDGSRDFGLKYIKASILLDILKVQIIIHLMLRL